MKRILQVVASLQVGGLETVAMNFVRYSDRTKYQFDFLTLHETDGGYAAEAKALGCNIYCMEGTPKDALHQIKAICAVIEAHGPYDVVHSHIFLKSGLVVYAAKKSGVPLCVAHSHSGRRSNDHRLDRRIYAFAMRKLLARYGDKFFACSRRAGDYVFGRKVFSQKGSVLLNAIDMDRFAFLMRDREQIREDLQIQSEQTVIGQVGHLTGVKNQRFLMKLFAEYRQEHDAVLLLVGDGELREELEVEARELGIAECVRMTGTRRDVGALLSAMDVFVLTSFREGLGIVLAEAMANGLYCVCEETAIVDEIKCSSACCTVRGFDAKNWCDKIAEIAERPRSTVPVDQEMLSDFAMDKFADRIRNAYEIS